MISEPGVEKMAAAARRIGIAWERNGKGPPVTRIGRDVVYRRSSVEEWLLKQEKYNVARRFTV